MGDILSVEEDKQDEAKRIAYSLKVIKQVQQKDPLFLRKVFVSHYLNTPYHLFDYRVNEIIKETGVYPKTLIEELYAASFFLIRNFELSPYVTERSLDDLIADKIEKGEI